jgi:queuosine biosynthesis protein QueD
MITIKVKHNLQMAHRLWNLPGKCQNIHGHTWEVILMMAGEPDERGIVMDYHDIKQAWRGWLDSEFDHRLVLDMDDPLLQLKTTSPAYPGVSFFNGSPTVEALATRMAEKARILFGQENIAMWAVELWEGNSNCASAATQ